MLNCDPAMSLGYVDIYSYNGSSWILQQTLTGKTDSFFGSAVAFSSNGTQLFLAVGADSDTCT